MDDKQGTNETATPVQDDELSSIVAQSLGRIESVYELLPGFVPAPTQGQTGVVAERFIPNQFLEAAAVAVERNPSHMATATLEPQQARKVISRNLRLEPLAAAAEALARDIRFNMAREREDVVQGALQVYGLAKNYARRSSGAALVSHVKTMRETLGRAGKTRKPVPPIAS